MGNREHLVKMVMCLWSKAKNQKISGEESLFKKNGWAGLPTNRKGVRAFVVLAPTRSLVLVLPKMGPPCVAIK